MRATAADDSTSGVRDSHTVLRLPGASSRVGLTGTKAPVSTRRTAAEPGGRWWQYAGLATRRAGWVTSLALIAAGLVTLWQLLFASSAGGDLWLGRDWEPPIQHRSDQSTTAPSEQDSDECVEPPTESVEPGDDSDGSDSSGSGSDDSCSEDGSDDDNSGRGSGGDDSGGDDDDSTSSPSPVPTGDDDSESEDNSGPGSSGDSEETDQDSDSDDGD